MNDELHDPELEAMLGLASGAFPDVNVAYESVRGRVRQAKRRRMVVVGSTACALLLAGGVLAVQAAGGSDGGTSVADTPTVVVVETSKITEPTESSESTETSEADESTEPSASSAPESSAPETTDAAPSTTEDRPSTSTGGGQGSSSSSNPSSTSGSSGSTGSTKPTVPPGTDKVVTSPGGDITYSLVDGVLSLVGEPRPAAGWEVKEIETEHDRIRVEFTDADHHTTWRIEIRTEGGKGPIETSSRG